MRWRSETCDRASGDPTRALSPAARRSPTAGAAIRVVEPLDLFPRNVLHSLYNELGDAIPPLHVEGSTRIEVHEQHADLVAIARVDEARSVQAGHTVAERQARARLHEPGVTLGDRNRDPGRHECTTAARFEARAGARREIAAAVARMLRRRKWNSGIETANADAERDAGGYPARAEPRRATTRPGDRKATPRAVRASA